MAVMDPTNVEAVIQLADELYNMVLGIDTVTLVPYAGGTIDVEASDVTAAKTRANTQRAALKTAVDALSDYV